MLFFVSFFLPLLLCSFSFGAPVTRRKQQARQVTTLATAELSGIVPLAQFARAAYCSPEKIQGWKCGEACDALPGFEATLTGGDGGDIQFFFVGFWPQANTVVVSHQGTDKTKLQSVLTDLNAIQGPLDKVLFPGVSSNVTVHAGFRDEHSKTANTILAEVKRLFTSKGTNSVTVVGHSLGGALAELDSLFFTLQLPSNTAVSAVTFGKPRVGDKDFAEFFDSKVPNFKRVNNQNDLVPIVPGRSLGFTHPSGEIHQLGDGSVVACSGNDNEEDSDCQIKTVPNIFEGDVGKHRGPYQGVSMGTEFCT
jgi:hypothetical protein